MRRAEAKIKEGVVTFSVRAVDGCRVVRRVEAGDLASYIDLLCPERVQETRVPPRTTTLPRTSRRVEGQSSRVTASEVVIPSTRERVQGIDPPHLLRFPTPLVAPIDVTSAGGAIYATAGVFDEHRGPSRIFRLQARRW